MLSVNEIQFDDVNEQIADLEIAKWKKLKNSWGFSGNKLSGILLPPFFFSSLVWD